MQTDVNLICLLNDRENIFRGGKKFLNNFTEASVLYIESHHLNWNFTSSSKPHVLRVLGFRTVKFKEYMYLCV